jgi:hypothetical protein
MKSAASVYEESPVYAMVKSLSVPSLRPTALRCIFSIFFNFFFRQYRAAWLPGRSPVSRVDHPLDLKIPFVPAWVTIYLDFVTYWVRMLSFLLRVYGRRAFGAVREFLASMGELYAFAAEAYQKNFSTTDRPFYIARPRFLLIHLVDPHLMCIPSLHVMVVIRTYTQFAAILRSLNEAEHCAAHIAEMKQGALAITQAILFVKQHSVTCIAAAMYAMTRFDQNLFPPEEAEAFTGLLFGAPPPPPDANAVKNRLRPCSAPRTTLPPADAAEIRAHIISLYRLFLAEGKTTRNWVEPLLHFLRQMPAKDCRAGADQPAR